MLCGVGRDTVLFNCVLCGCSDCVWRGGVGMCSSRVEVVVVMVWVLVFGLGIMLALSV